MEHVLIATLGDSPIVVTAMFDLLTQQEYLPIKKVIVIKSQGDDRDYGYEMIVDALDGQFEVASCELPFEDPYTEDDCFAFLISLFGLLNTEQSNGNLVHLSLAGGRKNMSALMGLAAPFYECVKDLYHVIDKDKKTFRDIDELRRLYLSDSEEDKLLLQEYMHPKLALLNLVTIPTENALHVDPSYLQRLSAMDAEQLQKRWDDSPEKAEDDLFFLELAPGAERLLNIFLTEDAEQDYKHLMITSANRVQEINNCLRSMHIPSILRGHQNVERIENSVPPSYVYNKGHTTERPFFHTEPDNILTEDASIDRVIVKCFPHHINQQVYRPSRQQLAKIPYTKDQTLHPLKKVLEGDDPDKQKRKKIPSILIVPMGTSPMIATQLYKLLIDRERRAIEKVVLVYPAGADEVYNSVQLVKKAFAYEQVAYDEQALQGLDDVASTVDCVEYQQRLEKLIEDYKKEFLPRHPDGRIDLALSGGRKGMAVLALFAAQRTQLHEVYHTLIANKQFDKKVEAELGRSRDKALYEKLFLRAYEGNKDDFRLFRVPIGPLHN